MRALLTDLDRTLTGPDLRLDPAATAAMRKLRKADVKVVVVTGRTLEHIEAVGLDAEVDGIVAENGCIVKVPADGREIVLGRDFAARAGEALGPLAARLHWGRVLGSGPRELAPAFAEALGHRVPHRLEYNAEEVMLLPHGVDKGSGALWALARLGIPREETAAIGDGDNDVAMFRAVRRSWALANASPLARAFASHVANRAYAEGFCEAAQAVLAERVAATPGHPI